MIGKSVEARAGTPDVIRSWGDPSVFTSDIDQLVLIERGEWHVSWFTLSLLMLFLRTRRISLFEMPFQEVGALKGSFCIGAEGYGRGRHGEAEDGGCDPHDVRGSSSQDALVTQNKSCELHAGAVFLFLSWEA